MTLRTAAICVPLTMAASVAMLGSAKPALKCNGIPIRFPDAPEFVYLLDAKPFDHDSLPKLDSSRLESVEVVCADYIYDTFGIKSRRGGVVIFTMPGPDAALKSEMDSIELLQTTYLAKHGRFAATLTELGWSEATGLITVDLTIVEDGAGWSATGHHRYIGGKRVGVTVTGRKSPRPD